MQGRYVAILEGAQGIGKSSACKILSGSGQYFSDGLSLNLADKDAMAHLDGKWVIELAELSALSKSDATVCRPS